MNSTKSKLFIVLAFLTLILSSASCKENSLAGRTYSAMYEGSKATLSFDNDGYALFNIEDGLSASLVYTEEKDGSFSGWRVSQPAMEFEGEFDDDDLLFVWWDGEPILMHRTDSGKSVHGIVGRKYLGLYGDSVVKFSFEKFGLVLVSLDDDTEQWFYTENIKEQEVVLRKEYYYEDGEMTLYYDDENLWGIFKDERIQLTNLNRVF